MNIMSVTFFYYLLKMSHQFSCNMHFSTSIVIYIYELIKKFQWGNEKIGNSIELICLVN